MKLVNDNDTPVSPPHLKGTVLGEALERRTRLANELAQPELPSPSPSSSIESEGTRMFKKCVAKSWLAVKVPVVPVVAVVAFIAAVAVFFVYRSTTAPASAPETLPTTTLEPVEPVVLDGTLWMCPDYYADGEGGCVRPLVKIDCTNKQVPLHTYDRGPWTPWEVGLLCDLAVMGLLKK